MLRFGSLIVKGGEHINLPISLRKYLSSQEIYYIANNKTFLILFVSL